MDEDETPRMWQLLVTRAGAIVWDARARLSRREVAAVCGRPASELATSLAVTRAQAAALFDEVPETRVEDLLMLDLMLFPKDPQTPPSPVFEWRGPLPVGGVWGVWFHPRTGETMRPHFSHAVFQCDADLDHVTHDVSYYDVGVNWVGESLGAGAALSRALLAAVSPRNSAAQTSLTGLRAQHCKLLLSEAPRDQVAVCTPTDHVLEMLNANASTLIVEDSVLRPTDALARAMRKHEALGSLVVAVRDLPADRATLADIISSTRSGYPTNAFASRLAARDVRVLLSKNDLTAVARSITGAAVNAFDGEGYVVLVGVT